MAKVHRLRIESRIENLAKLVDWIELFCKSHSPAAKREHEIQVIVEELFLNAINHGGASAGGNICFTLFPQSEGAALVMEAEGLPFDPREVAPNPKMDALLEDRPIGGLGLVLVRELSEQLSYDRVNGRNRLALVFGPGSLPQPQTAGHVPTQAKAAILSDRCRPRGATFKILAIMLIVLTAGLVATAGLNYLKFERILIEIAAARYDPVLRELNRAINNSLNSGVTLASTHSTQQLIDRSAAQFEGAFDLVIRDKDGVVLFGTAASHSPPTTLPPPDAVLRDFSNSNRFARHMSILQDGIAVGTLSLSFGAEDVMEIIPNMAQEFQRATVASLIFFVPLLVIVTVLVVGRIEGRLHSRMLAVERAEECRCRDSLAEALHQFQKTVQSAS
ncbi:MAG: ATP-binding protein [Acidimicrobiaceae bacterium]|nr:ATP-binding protein [Acidimicrobiaceae bacterium]